MGKEESGDGEEDAGERVGSDDHGLAANGVEEAAEKHGAENVAQGKGEKISADAARGDVIEAAEDESISEKDGVVEEGLGSHEDKTENRPPAMVDKHGARDFAERRAMARVDDGDGEGRIFGRRRAEG